MTQQLLDLDAWDPMLEHYQSPDNSIAYQRLKDPMIALTGTVRPINSRIGNISICEHFAKYANCADGDYCSKVHIGPDARERLWALQNSCEMNKDRIIMNSTQLDQLEIQPDPQILCLASVTSTKGPNNFYLLLPYERMNMANFTKDDLTFYLEHVQQASDAKVKLQKFDEQLAALFNHNYRIDNINDDIFPSQIVACKLSDDRFRRAMVLELPELASEKFDYKLFLVDLGIEVELPRERIFDIKSRFLTDPSLALNCRLNLKPTDQQVKWPDAILESFEKMARSEKYWLCRILSFNKFDAIYTVDLLQVTTRESLTEILIDNKMASCL